VPGSIISVGDYMYFGTAANFTGILTSIVRNGNVYEITIDSTPLAIQPTVIPVANEFWWFIKNPVAESHGILGHYCIFELTLESSAPSELFAVESEVMKSFP